MNKRKFRKTRLFLKHCFPGLIRIVALTTVTYFVLFTLFGFRNLGVALGVASLPIYYKALKTEPLSYVPAFALKHPVLAAKYRLRGTSGFLESAILWHNGFTIDHVAFLRRQNNFTRSQVDALAFFLASGRYTPEQILPLFRNNSYDPTKILHAIQDHFKTPEQVALFAEHLNNQTNENDFFKKTELTKRRVPLLLANNFPHHYAILLWTHAEDVVAPQTIVDWRNHLPNEHLTIRQIVDRIAEWEPLNLGEKAPQWLEIGIDANEAKTLIASGNAPDDDTIKTLTALNQPG